MKMCGIITLSALVLALSGPAFAGEDAAFIPWPNVWGANGKKSGNLVAPGSAGNGAGISISQPNAYPSTPNHTPTLTNKPKTVGRSDGSGMAGTRNPASKSDLVGPAPTTEARSARLTDKARSLSATEAAQAQARAQQQAAIVKDRLLAIKQSDREAAAAAKNLARAEAAEKKRADNFAPLNAYREMLVHELNISGGSRRQTEAQISQEKVNVARSAAEAAERKAAAARKAYEAAQNPNQNQGRAYVSAQ